MTFVKSHEKYFHAALFKIQSIGFLVYLIGGTGIMS